MLRTLRRLFLLLLFIVAGEIWRLPSTSAQNVPPIACPNYFQYLRFDNVYIGRITLPNLPMGTTRVEVQFSQREPVTSNYYGRLSLFHDQDTTVNSLRNGEAVSYRVDFPIPNVLPKLTNINVNGVDICSASDYPAPSTVLNLEHTLHTSVTHIRNSRPVNEFGFNPIESQPPSEGGFNFRQQFPDFNNPFGNQRPTQNRNFSFSPQQPRPRPPPPAPAPQPTTTTTTTTTTRRPTFVATPNRIPATTSQNINAICGREGTTPVIGQFVYGGQVLTRGQFPWLTAIYKKQTSTGGLTFLCGGSLISARTVVTAAHCFRHPAVLTAEQIVVYLGRHNLDDYEERFELRGVQKLLPHPDYNAVTFPDADIAIMQMLTAVSFTDFIQPICLWSEPTDINIIIGEKGVVAGWGADENGRAVSNLPKMVDGDIVSENTCLKSLEAFRMLTSPRTICAGNRDGTGPCMGDSGGGLMIKREGRWVLRGIVSAGQTVQQQCNLREYVIYCDLAKHIQWVQDNVLS